MIPAFDIFRIEPSGHVLWQGTQESFLKAKIYVHRIAMSSPGPYIIFNQITGEKVVLDQTDQTCVPSQVALSGVESGDAAQFGLD